MAALEGHCLALAVDRRLVLHAIAVLRAGGRAKELKELGPPWLPTNVDTTAYNSQPIIYPVVDGRLFARGGDGVYCYDLRQQ